MASHRIRRVFSGLLGVSLVVGCAQPQQQSTPLPTGRTLASDLVLVSQNVGSLPVNLITTPDGKFVITTDQGFRQSIYVTRTADGKEAAHVTFDNPKSDKTNGLYYGLALSGDRVLYAAQGAKDTIAAFSLTAEGKLEPLDAIPAKPGDFPAGLALDSRGYLFVTNNDPTSSPDKLVPGSLSIYDTKTRKEIGCYAFSGSFGGTPNFPLAVTTIADGSKTYVTSQRDGAVYVLDTADPSTPKLLKSLPTGAHPDALLLDQARFRLFVANAHSDTVSVVDTRTDAITHTVLLRPDIARDVAGATPTGLALSPDGRWLYVTLGDMNAVAVIDVPDMELEAYLPAGWYPTSLAVVDSGRKLMVANAKGTTPRNPNPPADSKLKHTSPLNIIEGNVVTLRIPSPDQWKAQTQRTLELARLTPAYLDTANPLAGIGLVAGKITHVIYIVKENRTYDHILGDLPQGNGDASLCLFPRAVTPNQHALAERFVLMDNFYDSGEVSGDGWTWSTQAMANEYVIRNVPYSYSGRGRTFDYEGTNRGYPTGGFPATGPDGKPLADHPSARDGLPAIPDVGASPGGHLWDMARRSNLSYRNYGFFVGGAVKRDGKTVVPDNYPSVTGLQPPGRDLAGITDQDFRRFDMDYADSDAPQRLFEQTGDKTHLYAMPTFGSHNAPSRFSQWRHEFDQMLAKDPSGTAVPALMTIRFCNDHTVGAKAGLHSPRAMVADNDYAVGQLVQAVSHSPIWPHTAIFIIEDDAQGGPDHVDAHRSTCYIISPYIQRASIDHTFHNTISCLRTIELLLGLPPMCQYDAAAQPIGNWTDTPQNIEPFTAILADAAAYRERNPGKPGGTSQPAVSPEQAELIRQSEAMNFAIADKAPAEQLNRIIWKTVKGYSSEPPTSPTGPNVDGQRKRDDDD